MQGEDGQQSMKQKVLCAVWRKVQGAGTHTADAEMLYINIAYLGK